MSVFDYPRINFAGMIRINPGTANNDDYSYAFKQPVTGTNLALIDSKDVAALTFGLGDGDFINWIQKAQPFDDDNSGNSAKIIPAEWNYYGDMSTSVDATVVGVQTSATTLFASVVPDAPLSGLVGAKVSVSGNVTDINSEGSPPATQFFFNSMSLTANGIEISGTPSKGVCQWIYFTRNVNLQGDAGAGGYVYHVVEGGRVALPGFDDPAIVGAVMRYYVFAKHGGASRNADIEAIYAQKGTNPADLQITGTIAPLYLGETIRSGPVGRLMTCDVPNVPTPPGSKNNANGKLALAPAVAFTDRKRVSVDFLGSFPENFDTSGPPDWSNPNRQNPKYDFGPLTLEVAGQAGTAVIGPVGYADTVGGNTRGWVFDFDISGNPAAAKLLADPTAGLRLRHATLGVVLSETDYYVVSNQVASYAEQGGPGDQLLSQGLPKEAATVAVFRRGVELSAADCSDITAWSYRTTPLGRAGDCVLLDPSLRPGQPVKVPTTDAGPFLLTFGVGATATVPPQSYNDYIAPPFTVLTNRPAISLRVLPNEDFSRYWTEGPDGPVGNHNLTFDVVFENVLRTYYLLFPAMNAVFPLNDEATVRAAAQSIIERTDLRLWPRSQFMPITRDMSESRRTLLQAWCRKVAAPDSTVDRGLEVERG